MPGPSYCDLCLPEEPRDTLKARVERCLALGYTAVAVDVRISQSQLRLGAASKKAKRAKTTGDDQLLDDFPPPPATIDLVEGHRSMLANGGKVPKILTRLTISFQDNGFLPLFNRSEVTSKYDVLAVVPPSAASLQALLKTGFQTDIVAFDVGHAFDVRWTRKLYRECLATGAHFELPYAPMIRDSESRKKIIGLAHTFGLVGRSRGLVLTSMAENAIELRQPTDVASLAFVLGMTREQGRTSVLENPLSVLAACQGRRMGPFRVRVERIADLEDGSKVPKLQDEDSESSDCDENSEDDQ
jgi:RNase P/RNase MRP subunit p30